MIVSKCERCGKNIEIKKAKEIEEIKCSHCNKEYAVDKRTRRNAMMILVVIVFISSLLIATISEAFNLSFFILMLPAIFIGFFAYRYTLWLLGKFNKLSYDEK